MKLFYLFTILLIFSQQTLQADYDLSVTGENTYRVSVEMGGSYGELCSSGFIYQNAKVMCRQLGYSGYTSYISTYNCGDDATYSLNNLRCNGDENNISECSSDQEFAGCDANTCVRLICKESEFMRVESDQVQYYYQNQWKSVCDTGFAAEEALTVCKQLRYTHVAEFQTGQACSIEDYWLTSMDCGSTVTRVQMCSTVDYTTDACTTSQCVNLTCTQVKEVENQIVVISENDTDNVICNDAITQNDVNVLCRQLGYQATTGHTYTVSNSCGSYSAINLDSLTCDGSEDDIFSCTYTQNTTCNANQCITLQCNSEDNYSVQYGLHGQLAISHRGETRNICDESITENEATVICNQLGGTFSYLATGQHCGVSKYWMSGLTCNGDESSINDCTYDSMINETCGYNQCVVLGCQSIEVNVDENNVVFASYEGGETGPVCDDDFDQYDANAICISLGARRDVNHPFSKSVDCTGGVDNFVLDDLDCDGESQSIYDCGYTTDHNCDSDECIELICDYADWDRCGPDNFPDLENEYLYNRNCDVTPEELVQCFTSLIDLEAETYTYDLVSQVDDESSTVYLNFQQIQQYTHISTCATYEFNIQQSQFVEGVDENVVATTTLNSEDEVTPTVQLGISLDQIVNSNCPSESVSEDNTRVYTCASNFSIVSNHTAQYIESFDLVVTVASDGFQIQDSLVMNVNTESLETDDEEVTVDVETELVVCSQGDYTPFTDESPCAAAPATLDSPYVVSKGTQVNIRHQITNPFYQDQYTLMVTSFKLGPLDITPTPEFGGPGFIDFSFVPQIAGELLEFKVTSVLASGIPRRNLQGEYEDKKVISKAYVKITDENSLKQDNNNSEQQIIVQKESEGNSDLTIAVISVLSVLIVAIGVGAFVYVRQAKKQAKGTELKYKEQQQQPPVETEGALTEKRLTKQE